jgi:hypothetical protein
MDLSDNNPILLQNGRGQASIKPLMWVNEILLPDVERKVAGRAGLVQDHSRLMDAAKRFCDGEFNATVVYGAHSTRKHCIDPGELCARVASSKAFASMRPARAGGQ